MTLKQSDKIKNKISKMQLALVADKKRWGYWHDGSGMRYLQPGLYLRLQDYIGALKYFKWFDKTFPDDSGYPIFLFEWTVTLFKTGDILGAEKKVLETFFSNTYILDKFLGKKFLHIDKYEGSNWEWVSFTEDFKYSKDQTELHDFVDWLLQFLASEKFYKIANEFIDIERKLNTEPVGQARSVLVERRYSLLDNYI